MLPDLRIVIAAVVSTFICTVGVGFYASTRLLQESLIPRTDSSDDSPVNRIALSWPEPLPVDRTFNLDFAVTAKASKNPVREIAPEPPAAESNAVATRSSGASDTREPEQAPDRDAPEPTPVAKEAAIETLKKTPADTTAADKVAAATALIEADPQPTGSIAEPAQIDPARDAERKTASLPDPAEVEQETQPQANAAAASGADQPVTRVRIVKKPFSGKPRAKRKARIAKSTTTSQNSAQLQFPFLWFEIPSSQF